MSDLKAGMKILEDVTPIQVLKDRGIERFHTVEEGMRELRQVQSEITQVGKYVNAHGFTPGREMQRIASIPQSIWSAVLELFPDAGVNKKTFYALLEGPLRDYDTRRKVSLT